MNKYFLRSVVLVGAVIQLLAPLFLKFDEGGVSEPVITPASYTFIIWSVIIFGCLVYAIYQLLPVQGKKGIYDEIALPLILVFSAYTLWLYAAGKDWIWLTVGLFVLMFTLLLYINKKILKEKFTPLEKIIIRGTLAIYLGWATVAIFANFAVALEKSGLIFPDERSIIAYSSILFLALANALWVQRIFQFNPFFTATVVWAFFGIVVGTFQKDSLILSLIALGAIGFIIFFQIVNKNNYFSALKR